MLGIVSRRKKSYGFIRVDDPRIHSEVFFHMNNVNGDVSIGNSLKVTFLLKTDSSGRLEAYDIQPFESQEIEVMLVHFHIVEIVFFHDFRKKVVCKKNRFQVYVYLNLITEPDSDAI